MSAVIASDAVTIFLSPQFALAAAAPVKAAANAHFTAGRFAEAVGGYNDALAILPPRPAPGSSDDGEGSDAEERQANVPVPDPVPQAQRGTGQVEQSRFVELAEDEDPEESLLLLECAKARAVLYSNMAACHLKLVSGSAARLACGMTDVPAQEDYKGAVAAASNCERSRCAVPAPVLMPVTQRSLMTQTTSSR